MTKLGSWAIGNRVVGSAANLVGARAHEGRMGPGAAPGVVVA